MGFGFIAGLVPEYWSFTLARMIIGMTTSGVFLVSYVLAMEMVGPSSRMVAGTLCQYYYTKNLTETYCAIMIQRCGISSLWGFSYPRKSLFA